MDVQFHNHGSIWLAEPLSAAAQEWLDEHIDANSAQYWGTMLVIEPRYIANIAGGMREAGLHIAGPDRL